MFKWIVGVKINVILRHVKSPLKKSNVYLRSSSSRKSDGNLWSDGLLALRRRRRRSSPLTGMLRRNLLLQKRIPSISNNKGSTLGSALRPSLLGSALGSNLASARGSALGSNLASARGSSLGFNLSVLSTLGSTLWSYLATTLGSVTSTSVRSVRSVLLV